MAEFSDAMAAVQMVQEAQDKVFEAQHKLRQAKRELTREVLGIAPADELVSMGVLSINIGTIRRIARMEERNRR